MDKILLGIAASTHPEGYKRALYMKMISSASKPLGVAEVTSILQLSSQWVVNEEGFLHDMGKQVFDAWAQYNPATFEEYFCQHFLISTLGESVPHPVQVIRFIGGCLKRLELKRDAAVKIIRMRVISLCRGFPDITIQSELCQLLLSHQDCIPEDSFTTTLCQTLITNTGSLEIPAVDGEMEACIAAVTSVGNLLRSVWARNPATIVPSLKHVFNIISTISEDESKNPSLALGALVQHIPVDVVEVVTKSAVTDASISDARMTIALQRMIDWLSWPSVANIDRWIVTFLTSLASVRKFTILINVTVFTVETMLVRLCFPVLRDSALRVLSHMLLSFQHSPEAFHKIIDQLPKLMQRLGEEKSASSQSCMTKMAELVYCLMYHHAGYPELYDTLLDALKDFPRPSEDTMLSRLKQSAWSSQTSGGGMAANLSSKFAPRSDTGKTGLVNLGNTCYMNSVIQALFMTQGFREDILSYPLFNRQSIMYTLQLSFAFLAHTQRAAYAPKDFLRTSRPPWFAPGSQQDCSEFLKYLLGRLDEEEKGWRKMVSKAAASLTSSLASSASTSSSAVASPERPECSQKWEEKMDTEASTSSVEESSLALDSPSTSAAPVTLSDSNQPVSHPSDEETLTSDVASCSSSLDNESRRQTNLQSGGKSFASMKKLGSAKFKESIVERYFGGKSATHIQCLNCGTVSSRTEQFFDLPLAFPGTEGRESLLGGRCDAPAEERRSEKSEYATMDLPQDSRNVVGASAIVASVSAEHHENNPGSSELYSAAGSSAEVTASKTCLEDLLRHYLRPEMLIKDNRYHCDKCQSLQDAEKSLEIINAPSILILTLLRFSYDVKQQRRCKIMEDVRYPQVLHLDVNRGEGECSSDGSHGGPCTKRTRQNSAGSAHCSTKSDENRTVKYMLSGVVVHSGMSSESGHYYCYACDDVDNCIQELIKKKRMDKDEMDRDNIRMAEDEDLPHKWYLFNDSRVTASKFDSFGNVTQRFPRDTAYVLLYRRCEEELEDGEAGLRAALRSMQSPSSSSTSLSSTISTSIKEKHLRKDLQEAIRQDNSNFIKEQELEARAQALQNRRPASATTPFFPRNFDDKNDPPGGCGLGGGGGGGGGLGLSSNRLVF